jgi:uncharacterized protein (TIGR01777 family)
MFFIKKIKCKKNLLNAFQHTIIPLLMASILITGGTGMIGSALTKELVSKGHQCIILTRDSKPKSPKQNISYATWNVEQQTIDEKAIQLADFIVHLAGANVAKGRWTASRKRDILDSRVDSGNLIVKALKEIPNKVKAVLSASAIGRYGPDPEIPNPNPFVETDPVDNSFLGATCSKWEEAIQPVQQPGKRLVIFRIGIVLSNEGGAYAEFKKPLKSGIASILGNGKQMVSWIHITDLIRLIIYAIDNEKIKGTYNAVAPHPVSNAQLINEMAKHHGMHLNMHIPAFALKTILGEMSVEILKSATVSSAKIQNEGFQFHFSSIENAVQNLSNK